ncbi:MAG: prephenate dehydrogenase [Calditrichia bacterium]|nr:prephenate dehydrogenase [Calditrichia bacterium]
MKILILGAGNMGRWLVEQLNGENSIALWDNTKSQFPADDNLNCLKNISDTEKFNPDMAINAVSLNETINAFNEVLPYLNKNCILADIASVKTGLHEYYKSTGKKFVSTHPMFGPTFGNMQTLSGENAVIITESDYEGKTFFNNFFKKLNLTIHEFTFEEHDKTTAWSLSTPFVSSLVFAACMKKQKAPGTTFKKHLNIAKGLLNEDNALLAEILFNPYSIDQIEKINSQLRYLTHIIKDRDTDEMVKFLNKLRINIEGN